MDKRLRMKILIVDDEPDILDIIAEEFSCHGHDVFISTSGNKAIELLKKEKFDFVVSDFKMPNGNGLDILKFVNMMDEKPIFFFVSGQSDLSIENCIKLGARQFFSKPFDCDELVFEVEKEFRSSVEEQAA